MSTQKHSKKPSEPTQVRHTGDWSGDSKLSSIQNGYWDDPFFKEFNRPTDAKIPKRTALICRGYFVRFKLCDYYLKKILTAVDTPMQILSFGCGMDTTYFRLESHQKYAQLFCKFFELDFSSVIQRKRTIISSSTSLERLAKTKLVLIEGDLRNLSTLYDTLLKSGFDFDKPTLFYSECVVNYLKPNESCAILHWITQNVKNCVWLAYEQCYPNDGFGKLMVSHFQKNGCPIQSIESNGDMESQKRELEDAKFQHSAVFNVWDTFVKISRDDKFRFPEVNEAQQFDEYESFIVTCLHYSIRLGSNIILNDMEIQKAPAISRLPILKYPTDHILTCEMKSTFSTQCSVMVNNNLWLIGGTNKNGTRLANLTKVTCTISQDMNYLIAEETHVNTNGDVDADSSSYFERVHSAAVFTETLNSIFIFGGRKSPRLPCSTELICIKLSKNNENVESVFKVQPAQDTINSSLPCTRWRHTLNDFLDTNGNVCLFLFGGKTEKETLHSHWIYHCATNIWKQETLSADAESSYPSERHSHTMCTDTKRGSLFLIGGVTSNSILCEDSFWQYEYHRNAWIRHKSHEIYARKVGAAAVLHVHDDELLILGGYGDDSTFKLEHFLSIINLITREARHYELSLDPRNIFLPFGFSAHLLFSGQDKSNNVVICGGGGNCFSFGTHYNDKCLVLKLRCVKHF